MTGGVVMVRETPSEKDRQGRKETWHGRETESQTEITEWKR